MPNNFLDRIEFYTTPNTWTAGTTAATTGTIATSTTLDENIVNINGDELWHTVRPYDATGVRRYDVTESLDKLEALCDRVEKLEKNMSLLMRMFDKLTAKQMKELLE